MDDKQLVRAGLDYHEFASLAIYENWADCAERFRDRPVYAVSTKGQQRYDRPAYDPGDVFLFGPESRGLPVDILKTIPEQRRIRLPMVTHSRSLNLSNTVAVVLYEAWRHLSYKGGE